MIIYGVLILCISIYIEEHCQLGFDKVIKVKNNLLLKIKGILLFYFYFRNNKVWKIRKTNIFYCDLEANYDFTINIGVTNWHTLEKVLICRVILGIFLSSGRLNICDWGFDICVELKIYRTKRIKELVEVNNDRRVKKGEN